MYNLHYLLKEINLIRERYFALNEEKEHFNIFTTLRDQSEEVTLHSRFISSILDPHGLHGMGRFPLDLFLNVLDSKLTFTNAVFVMPNHENWTEYHKIDILIRDNSNRSAIIVENKIYASDSNHVDRGQLEGYYQLIQKEGIPAENIEVYYLTLDRHEPSEESLNTNGRSPDLLDKVRCIDYATEIKSWMTEVAKEAFNKPFVRESVNQYINLISNMTGDVEVKERLDLLALIGKNEDNLYSTRLLLENYKHVCWHALDYFNNEFIAALENAKLKVVHSPSTDDITNLIHGGPKQRNILFYYAFEDKDGLVWQLQSENNVKGFYLGVSKALIPSMSNDMKAKCKEYAKSKGYESEKTWLCWFYISDSYPCPRLYLWDFAYPNTDTFDLLSPTIRKQIIDSYVNVIVGELKDFKKFKM